jgi:hypothetical protein
MVRLGRLIQHEATMLHLMKLAIGARDIAHMRAFQAERNKLRPPLRHLTRNAPRRAAEIVEGGSMYWVVAGAMIVRQRIVAIRPDTREDGTACTALLLDPELMPVTARLMKPFQGWRYLAAQDAPRDIGTLDPSDADDLPASLRRELHALCLL